MTSALLVPSTGSAITTLAGITVKRLLRGKALWIAVGITALQVVYASFARGHSLASLHRLFETTPLLLAIVPPILVAGSVGDEIGDRTSTYLWSRPLARWTVLAGKLCALAPIAIVLLGVSWALTAIIATGDAPPVASCFALAAGCLATSLVAASIATVIPRYAMAMAICYMLVDAFVGAMPFTLAEVSLTHQTDALAGLGHSPDIAEPLIALVIVAGLWSAVALRRVSRLEV